MQSLKKIYALAVAHHAGEKNLEGKLAYPKTPKALLKITDDRWLSGMTKSIFQAGFVWRVVDNKWQDFEEIFSSFDLVHCAFLSDEDIERLTNEPRVIRHLKKLQAVRTNASFLLEVAEKHGSAAKYFTSFGPQNYVELLLELKKNASRLGGMSAQYFLRRIGIDAFILSRDVVNALIRENVINKQPSSQRDLHNVQTAFNHWRDESGRSLSEISRILALSTG